jgi:hypothetical protein
VRRLSFLLAGLLLALPAQASAQNKLFQDYKKNGTINPCNYSPSELKKGLAGLPPDVEAYVPGLSDSLRRGCGASGGAQPTQAQQSAAGPVASSGGSSPPPGAASTQGGRSVVPRPPAPKLGVRDVVAGTAPKVPDGPLPDIPAWLAALLAAALAGGAAVLVAVRYGALDPSGIMRSLRAALARR